MQPLTDAELIDLAHGRLTFSGSRTGAPAWRSGRPEALELADDRRREYLEIYRGMLGFAWLILLRASTTAA